MKGHTGRGGARYPGLLDRSPALSLVDQTVIDPDGADRDVRQHRLVFVFDPEVHRETLPRGEVWLEEIPEDTGGGGRCVGDARPGAGSEED